MKKTLIGGVALAAIATPVAVMATSNHADAATWQSGKCVTKAEYRRIHRGDTIPDVRWETGTSGKITVRSDDGDYRYQSREYRVCGSNWGRVWVEYDNSDAVDACEDAALDDYINSDDYYYTEPDCSGFPMVMTSKSAMW